MPQPDPDECILNSVSVVMKATNASISPWAKLDLICAPTDPGKGALEPAVLIAARCRKPRYRFEPSHELSTSVAGQVRQK
jgi:hypothetical protein